MNSFARCPSIGSGTAWLVPALAILLVAASAAGQPRRHALLVGIADYQHVDDLQGPSHDVDSLKGVLQDWEFDYITTLVDGEATRDAILKALDNLILDTTAGDHVFIYFSGHGTSFRNFSDSRTRMEELLDPATGGLFPVDLDPRAPDATQRLIVGSLDLRPRLLRLDADRQVFVVFDACYSGNAVKSISCARERFQPWEAHPVADRDFGAQTWVEEPYPYENLLYLSASAVDQVACDIREEDLWRTPTVDGRPHGALTDALLRGLSGEANTDGNGALTIVELHEYVRRRVEAAFPQTPQLLYPEDRPDARSQPVFGVAHPARPGAVPSATPLRVWLGAGADVFMGRLVAVDGVTVSTSGYDPPFDPEARPTLQPTIPRHEVSSYDLRIDPDDGRPTFTVQHASGEVLAAGLNADDTVRRVVRHRAVHALLKEAFVGQAFNVRVEIPRAERERRVRAASGRRARRRSRLRSALRGGRGRALSARVRRRAGRLALAGAVDARRSARQSRRAHSGRRRAFAGRHRVRQAIRFPRSAGRVRRLAADRRRGRRAAGARD